MDQYTSNLDTLHHIQRSVLEKLTHQDVVSYSELLPDGMSGNAFNYHLNHLLKQRVIEKSEDGYKLTSLGRLVVDSMSLREQRFKLRPVCGALLYVEHGDSKKVLLYRSKRQPLIGSVGLPFGKLRVGGTYKETVQRMLKSRGLDSDLAAKMVHLTPYSFLYKTKSDELVSHRVGEVWKITYGGEMLTNATENGESFWGEPTEGLELGLIVSGETLDQTIIVD